MDVDVVESVGKQLNSQSQSVTSLIKTVDRLVASADAHWYGTRGREFVNSWRNVHRPALVAAASAVEGLGRSALQNASAQRRVSATGGAATTIGDLGGGTAPSPGVRDAGLWAASGFLLNDAAKWLTENLRDSSGKKFFHGNLKSMQALKRLGKWVPVLGAAFGGEQLVDSVGKDDLGGAGGAAVDLSLVAGGVAVAAGATFLAPVVVIGGAGKIVADVAIPYSDESQDELLDFQSGVMFGKHAADLTPSQSQQLVDRYSGVGGYLNMTGDQIHYSYEKASDAVSEVADSVQEFAGWVGSKFPKF